MKNDRSRTASRMRMPRRQLWLIVLVETVFAVALAVWVLVRLDRLFEPVSWVVALAIIAAGDLATVVLMQALAPTRVTFAAGDRVLTGEALDGFGDDHRGRVLIGGERWLARCHGSPRMDPGDLVRVVARDGLTLVVERLEANSDNAHPAP